LIEQSAIIKRLQKGPRDQRTHARAFASGGKLEACK
jgi:hypothetical protein